MPTMANITAQNAAGANVTFEVVTPSAGDGQSAIWQLTAASTVPIGRPRAEISSRFNAEKTARKVQTSLTVPFLVTDSVTGLQRVAANIICRNGEWTIPRNIPDNIVADAVAYYSTLTASLLWKDSIKSGYAPV